MLPPIVSEILPLLLSLIILWVLIRLQSGSSQNDELVRLQTRLDEYSRRFDKLDEKLNELRLEQQSAASQLREQLMTAFAQFREELKEILSP